MVALLVLLLAGGGVAAYLLTRPTQKVVPPVVNESVSVATTTLQNAGFKVEQLPLTNDKPAGTVFAQDPLGGTKVDEGSTVTLKVSTGPGNAPIPSVVGLSKAAAIRKIRSAGLKVGDIQTKASDTIPAGNAIGTDPSAGQSQEKGTTITLFVSSGKPLVNLPDVTGEDVGAAKAQLTGDGFNVKT